MEAIIYARVSSTTDRQNTARQITDLTKYAEYRQLHVARVFEEKISGAKKAKDRPVLSEAIQYCKDNGIGMILVSELSRLGRNAFDVLNTVNQLVEAKINLYLQKEQFTLLNEDGKPSTFAPIMLATLSTCAELERENIYFRLKSGRDLFIEKGGKLGRKEGSVKSKEQKSEEYKKVIRELRQGTSVRKTAKLCDVSTSTVQRLKSEFGL